MRQRWLGISPEEASFERRGFSGGNLQKQQHLERIGGTFLQGYNRAIASDSLASLVAQLEALETDLRGFGFEGAAMGLALLDFLTPWKRHRLQAFLAGAGGAHAYMVYVGWGWLLARLPGGVQRYLRQLQGGRSPFPDPLLGWLAIDGYGFHQGYFSWRRYVEGIAVPEGLEGYSCRAFDQGLGRSLWFVRGAEVSQVARAIGAFPPDRRADLWSGVGLACTYAGGAELAEVEVLRQAAGGYLPEVAQGAAFAAQARRRAGNLVPQTEMACQVLCGLPAAVAAEVTQKTLDRLPVGGRVPAYETWRSRIQAQFGGTSR